MQKIQAALDIYQVCVKSYRTHLEIVQEPVPARNYGRSFPASPAMCSNLPASSDTLLNLRSLTKHKCAQKHDYLYDPNFDTLQSNCR